MEMERTRRSVDRTRELPAKKPRLAEDPERDRGATVHTSRERPAAPTRTGVSSDPRFRSSQRDGGGGGYQPQPQTTQQQMQELVAEYKTALAELTFNSKPIITNLTIIAGENINAAKGIAAIICAHILEVPSDQKLPSLYLLDSIVKNIGRDYIKYFAARLPEVFCKAYRQVDASIHSGMKHLYGTWKGVFPLTTLQLIEKELFPSTANTSASRNTDSASASQTQRTSRSIHVNPKYLEARQRLQQSSHPKVTSHDNVDSSAEDLDRPDRTSGVGSWPDSSTAMQGIQYPMRELPTEPSRKNSNLVGKNVEYVTDSPQYSDSKVGRTNKVPGTMDRSGPDSSLFGTRGTAPETSVEQRNGYDFYTGKYKETRSSQILGQLPNSQTSVISRNQDLSRNWKNSEEEEYMWDDMSSKFADNAEKVDMWKNQRKSEDSQKHMNLDEGKWSEPYWNKFDRSKGSAEKRFPLSMELDENSSHSRNQYDGHVSQRESYLDSLCTEESMPRTRNLPLALHQESSSAPSFNHASMFSRVSGHPESHQPHFSGEMTASLTSSHSNAGLISHLGMSVSAASSSLGVSSSLKTSLPTASFQHGKALPPLDTQLAPQSSQFQVPNSEQFNQKLPSKFVPESFPVRSSHIMPSQTNLQPAVSQRTHNLETLRYTPLNDSQNQLPVLHQSHYDQPLPRKEAKTPPPNRTGRQSIVTSAQHGASIPSSLNPAAEVRSQSTAADLLAAIMKTRLVSSNATTDVHTPIHQPPLPGGPPPIQAGVPSISTLHTSTDAAQSSSGNNTPPLEVNHVNPPLPPGPPPHSSIISQHTSSNDGNLNPLSSLLSSLVAKGIISSQGSETKAKDAVESSSGAQISSQLPSKPDKFSSRNVDSTVSVVDPLPIPSSANELSTNEEVMLSTERTEDSKDLIGCDFRPEIIRTLHTVVINALFDDLKQQCRKCGLRFGHQEQLNEHLQLHDSREQKLAYQTSRKWFANLNDFVCGNSPGLSCSVDVDIPDAAASGLAGSEPMVPADESQCICAFCAEPFEDFYCLIRDMWMYKGTVHIKTHADEKQKDVASGLIVHAKCIPESLKDAVA